MLQYCDRCNGIVLHWRECKQEWFASYVDGGMYCDCDVPSVEESISVEKEDD